ncbi:GAF domain-containing protein [Flavobacteriaceae bacterium MHTCC 0001]
MTDLYFIKRAFNYISSQGRNYTFLNTFTKTFIAMTFKELKTKVTAIVSNSEKTVDERLLLICKLLEANISYYNWVGFYFRNGDKEELKLGPYVGAPTDHTIIPFGKGICGQVAVSNQNFVVPDVSAQDNYIACSISVKSEIVIPIFVTGENIGQIDIDSNTPDPFTEADERFLEFVCSEVGTLLEIQNS